MASLSCPQSHLSVYRLSDSKRCRHLDLSGYRIVSLRQLQMFQTLAHLCLRTFLLLVCPIKPMKGNLAVRGLYRHIDNIGGKTAGIDMTGSWCTKILNSFTVLEPPGEDPLGKA